MIDFRTLQLSTEEVTDLRGRLLQLDSVTPILSSPKLLSRLAALGIQQEIGTINDELARFIYDVSTGNVVARETMRATLIEYHGFTGVRIWAEGSNRLELRLSGMRELLHPSFSFNTDGTVKELVIFPESVAKIARLQDAELVFVREWALNTIFGGFDRTKPFYETNTWELVHNDALRYSELLEKKQIALIGTHDLSAHVAGLSDLALTELKTRGGQTRQSFARYFGAMKRPSVYSLVLPYAAGVILDDLAQPRNYGSVGRQFVLSHLMNSLEKRAIDPARPMRLIHFPDSYEKLIRLARSPDLNLVKRQTPSVCRALIQELRQFSISLN